MAPAAAADASSLWNSSSSPPSNKVVCVMDASGRLGSALVRRLLHHGYTVHAAFNNHHHAENDGDGATGYNYRREWSNGDGKAENLKEFSSVDPLDYGSIMEAVRGCSALFYSFELPADHPTYDEFMGELEVRAAHNVLEACARTHTIDKVVFTSSATAVIWRDHHHHQSQVDERNWSDVGFCKKFKLWHGLSKTLAEKTAWALAMDRGVNMVSINGGLLMCPELSIKDPYLLGAAEMFRDGVFVTVDLDFLVDAHVYALEDPASYGRYLCFNRILNCTKEVLNLATMLLPSSSPQLLLDDNKSYQQRISNSKIAKLMMDFHGAVE